MVPWSANFITFQKEKYGYPGHTWAGKAFNLLLWMWHGTLSMKTEDSLEIRLTAAVEILWNYGIPYKFDRECDKKQAFIAENLKISFFLPKCQNLLNVSKTLPNSKNRESILVSNS